MDRLPHAYILGSELEKEYVHVHARFDANSKQNIRLVYDVSFYI